MSERIRILFIVPRFGTVTRGVETFVLELISRLDLDRFAVTVLSALHDVTVPGVSFEQGKLLLRERLAWLDRMPLLCRLLRPLGIGGSSEIETLTLLRGYRRHWHLDVFDVVVPLGGTWSYRFARKTFPSARIISLGQAGPVKRDLACSDMFVGLTPYDEARARTMWPGLPTCVIPNGVDTVRFSPRSEYRSDGAERTILCAAALVPDKRHDLLFNAVMRLPNNVSVRCVGAGTHRAELEKHPLARAGRVEFRQYTFAEMPDVYRRADVFSLASPEEAFGIVFIEAMASGLPVVAHNGPRQQYVVSGGGVLCDVHDPDAYASAIASVLYSAASDRARVQAMQFDWSRIVADYETLLSRLVRSSQ